MENKRAGFSFKAVGVVGFVLLTFLLIRVLRMPDGVVPSEMVPNFLMLLLGVMVLGSSFILLALGRIVELLQGFNSTQTMLSEIRDETERVRIESQYIYEVQKDTLVKLTTINEAAQSGTIPNLGSNPAQQVASQIASNETNKTTTTKTGVASGITSRGASFAASRLSKNIGQAKTTPSTERQDELSSTKLESGIQAKSDTQVRSDTQAKSDIQANTDESTWSSLVGQNDATNASTNLPVSDVDYDKAAVDGSDDIVDAIPQPKTWKPLADDELVNDEYSHENFDKQNSKRQDSAFTDSNLDSNLEAKVTEVSEAEVGESLDEAVVNLESNKLVDRSVDKRAERQSDWQPERFSNKEKPVFEDRLSQTEKSLQTSKISPDNAVRYGSFPASNEDNKSDFTLQDITEHTEQGNNEEGFAKASNSQLKQKDASSSKYTNDGYTEQNSVSNDDDNSLEKVFSTVKDTGKTSYNEETSFVTKGFGSAEDSFETAEDSFDDIREVFDTKAKKLASDVKDMTNVPTTQNRIKDSLKRASNKVARETSDLGKNLN